MGCFYEEGQLSDLGLKNSTSKRLPLISSNSIWYNFYCFILYQYSCIMYSSISMGVNNILCLLEIIDDEEEHLNRTVGLHAMYEHYVHPVRRSFVVRQRISWDHHVYYLEQENMFRRPCRMALTSFRKLLTLLKDDISVNAMMSERPTGRDCISAAAILHCLLRWFSNGSYMDVRIIAGMS